MISGGDSTRLFQVFGKLSLQHLILAYGYSGSSGSAILIRGGWETLRWPAFIVSAFSDVEAYISGGGVFVDGVSTIARKSLVDIAAEEIIAELGVFQHFGEASLTAAARSISQGKWDVW